MTTGGDGLGMLNLDYNLEIQRGDCFYGLGTTPARMAPLILCSPELVSSLRYPITQLYRNSTPARWWGLNKKKIPVCVLKKILNVQTVSG